MPRFMSISARVQELFRKNRGGEAPRRLRLISIADEVPPCFVPCFSIFIEEEVFQTLKRKCFRASHPGHGTVG